MPPRSKHEPVLNQARSILNGANEFAKGRFFRGVTKHQEHLNAKEGSLTGNPQKDHWFEKEFGLHQVDGHNQIQEHA
ncbi:MAG: hypothetical protein GOV15_04355, partial [Candidatus Diapherotrites archaeon]|nr:hypothetical protein [Candidatus Diapherotrites archaeon]